jgi:lysophospholipase
MVSKSFDRRRIPPAASFSTWRAPDGWDHRRFDWRQPAGTPVRGSLLFANGRGDFIEKYLEAYDHWYRAGWNVTAFDWRGQGGSRGGIHGGHLDDFEPLVDDLEALLEEWRARSPAPHVAIGHSMGGHVLLRTLAERGPALDAAVLVAPMLMINSAPLPPLAAWWVAGAASLFGLGEQPAWRQSASPAGAGSYRQTCLTGCAERYEDELWWWGKEPAYNLGAPSWGWLKAAYASCAALTPKKLAGVRTPLLLLGTERDRLVSPAAIRAAAGHLPSAELAMLPEAAHEILRETDEHRLGAFERIDAFVERHAPRP